jgi:ABC-type lipoprotein release transport system permease subunit
VGYQAVNESKWRNSARVEQLPLRDISVFLLKLATVTDGVQSAVALYVALKRKQLRRLPKIKQAVQVKLLRHFARKSHLVIGSKEWGFFCKGAKKQKGG